MFRSCLIALALLAATPLASAQVQEISSPEAIASETYQTRLPGPAPGESRGIYFWRPPGVEGPLPVLYMADGLGGLKVAVSRLRPAIIAGRARPLLVVAMEPSPLPRRMKEYVPGEDTRQWDAHFAWFVGTVIPWAEANAGASRRAAERGVGGVSNGADFALGAAARRPDLFSAVLAHSPVNDVLGDFAPSGEIRWALTAGGQRDYEGRAQRIQSHIAQLIDGQAPLRRCLGPWRHDIDSWLDISPGAIAWLFDLAPEGAIDAPLERQHCETHNA